MMGIPSSTAANTSSFLSESSKFFSTILSSSSNVKGEDLPAHVSSSSSVFPKLTLDLRFNLFTNFCAPELDILRDARNIDDKDTAEAGKEEVEEPEDVNEDEEEDVEEQEPVRHLV